MNGESSQSEAKPQQDTGPEPLLGPMLRAARQANDLSQAQVAKSLGVSPPAVSNFENSERLPSIGQTAGLARILELNLEQLTLAWTWEQVRSEKPQEWRASLLNALRNRLDELKRKAAATCEFKENTVTLREWRAGLDIRTVLVGDRRESPPHSYADVLALPASACDLFYFGDLGLGDVRIRSDKIVKLADSASLRSKLDHDILVVGSPAANLAARQVNADACFRFLVQPEIHEREERFEKELAEIAYEADALEAYVTASSGREMKRIKELRHLLYDFARPGIVDPVDYVTPRGVARLARWDYGFVSLCRHPWCDSGVAVFAAGISGPGTAVALKLLATEGAFDDRPLGGVFRVYIATEARWEDRYDLLKPQWETHPYTLEKYKADVIRLREQGGTEGLSAADADGILGLLELLEKRAAAMKEKAH